MTLQWDISKMALDLMQFSLEFIKLRLKKKKIKVLIFFFGAANEPTTGISSVKVLRHFETPSNFFTISKLTYFEYAH